MIDLACLQEVLGGLVCLFKNFLKGFQEIASESLVL